MVASPPLPRRFEAVRELAADGSGVVIEAIDREGAVRVAFKILRPPAPGVVLDRDHDERLRREFAVAAAVRHPNLVRLGELHELDGRWGMSMELIDGPALFDWVRRGADDPDPGDSLPGWGSLDSLRPRFLEGRVRTAVGQIAAGLAALHGAGIVHRDLRPDRLRIDRGERVDRVVVLELGLAALATARGDPAARAGVVEYLAPEQVGGGRVTTASDLYALGAILFEIVTGRPPFVGAPRDVRMDKLEQPAPRATALVPELARDLDELCARLLDRDPARRPSAADVAAQFGTPNQPRATTANPHVREPRRLDGRDAELALLRAAVDAVPAARPIVYVVHGPLGIGKSALLDQVAREAAGRGALVCAGRCTPRPATRFAAWDSFIDGISRHLAALDPAARAALLPDDAAAITHLFPSFARVAPARSSTGTRDELIARGKLALRALLLRLTRAHRLIAILDDAHAAEEDNLDLLCELLQPPAPSMITLFGVRVTPASVAAERARMLRLAALPIDLRFLPLGPLPEAVAVALAARLLGTDDGAAALARAGAGNPLFVEQLALAPAPPRDDLVELVAARIEAMPASARAILRVLAAAAGPVRHDVLGSALGLSHRVVVRDLAALADAQLARTTGSRRNDLAELHHDVVAEAVRLVPPPDGEPAGLTTEHALLGAALDNSGLGDDRARLRHWLAAGDRDRAGALAIAMVARARDSLAFTVAATGCDAALAMAPPPVARAALLRARADALIGAGDATAAAHAYLDAAAAADALGQADDALDARRLAAEHLLRSGDVERGLAIAQAVAAPLGIDLARSNGRLVGKLLIERARCRLRGTALADAPDLAAAQLADVCASLAVGYAMIDTLRAAWFTSRGVRAALDSGDPRRAARALALESCVQVARGGPGRARARRALAVADALLPVDSLAPDRDRADHALLETARAGAACLSGEFVEAIARADQARELYRDCSPRVGFEPRTATLFAITAAAWLGRWAEAGRRRLALAREAEATGDRYSAVYAATGYGVVAELATGDAVGVRRAIADAMRDWPRDRAPALHAREVIAIATCDLYAGAAAAAGERIADAWPALEDAYVLDVEHVRATLLELSARAALGCGQLADAGRDARRLAQIGWSRGPALLLEAALAAHGGGAPVLELLARAAAACDAAGLAAHVAAARDRWGRLAGGDAGRDAVTAARAQAADLGLGDPDRAFAFLAPWPR